jgi:hypothetical protein
MPNQKRERETQISKGMRIFQRRDGNPGRKNSNTSIVNITMDRREMTGTTSHIPRRAYIEIMVRVHNTKGISVDNTKIIHLINRTPDIKEAHDITRNDGTTGNTRSLKGDHLQKDPSTRRSLRHKRQATIHKIAACGIKEDPREE